MKKINISIFLPTWLTALILSVTVTSCVDDVDVPMPIINLNYENITAPSVQSSVALNIQSNCDWFISITGENSSWARVSLNESTGSANIRLSFSENNSGKSRSAVLNISNRANTVGRKIEITQHAASTDGSTKISEIRELAANGTYRFESPAIMRATVVSSPQVGNFYSNRIAVVGSSEKNNGIMVATNDPIAVDLGKEVEIALDGATVSRNAETGIIEIVPADDSAITVTDATAVVPTPIEITAAQLASGEYESMSVIIKAQVSHEDLEKENIGGVSLMNDFERDEFNMIVMDDSQLAGNRVPTGSGTLTGVVMQHNNTYCIAPQTADDILMEEPRYAGGGITFPYVFSFFQENKDEQCRYVTFNRVDADVNSSDITANDGTGASMRFNLSKKNLWLLMWTDASGHHNTQLRTFADVTDNDVTFIFPLGQSVTKGLRLQFGWGSKLYAPANWIIEYSVDGSTWYRNTSGTTPDFVIPKGKEYGGGKNYFYYTVDIPNPAIPILSKQTLYVKVRPVDNTAISGGKVLTTGAGCDVTAHSCFLVDKIPSFSTTKPADAIWFQPFDKLTEGADYRLGDRLCAMLNYCGNDIADWSTEQKGNMTGTNVRQRPGYAQIGFVDNEYTNHLSYTNQAGVLTTPALGKAGNLTLSFDAMAFNNTAVYQSGGAVDFGGDSRIAVIEVIGGGTIDGVATKVVKSLSYTEFKNYSFTITGATPNTRIKFTSPTDDKRFTRWFIDNICVKSL